MDIDNNVPIIGDRYYGARNGNVDDIEFIRIKRVKNENCFVIQQDDGTEKKVDKSYFNNYIKLIPDAKIFVAAVDLQNGLKDVVVALYRTKDLEVKSPLPFAICRQSVYNLFAEAIRMKGDNNRYIGISINQENCPVDVNFKMFLSCNGISFNTVISSYIGDTLDDILTLINKTSKYDDVLKIVNAKSNEIPNLVGVCYTLKDLLKENDFMFDFYRAFGITKIDFKVKVDEQNHLELNLVEKLENILRVEIFNTYVVEYDRDTIDVSEIQGNYVIVLDTDNKMYLIQYDKGEYLNKIYKENMRNKRDAIITMKNILASSK